MLGISAYLNFYNDFTFIKQILNNLNGHIDELIIVDGPYEYCVDNLKIFNLYYDENNKPSALLNLTNSANYDYKIKYFYKCWRDEKEKRIFGYEKCSYENILLVDSDEFFYFDKNNMQEFLNSDKCVAGFEIYNMHRINQYFSKAHKNIFFKKKYINSYQHLSYTWLVGVDDLEKINQKLIFCEKYVGTIYHQTLNRNKIGNIIKYIFYISLYNFNRQIPTNKLIPHLPTNKLTPHYDIHYLKNILSLEELYVVFSKSMMEMLNMPNVLSNRFILLDNLKIDLSEYNYNHIHGYFTNNVKLLKNINFYFFLDNKKLNNKPLILSIETINVKQLTFTIYEIYLNKSNYEHVEQIIFAENNIIKITCEQKDNSMIECLMKINCDTFEDILYTINKIDYL